MRVVVILGHATSSSIFPHQTLTLMTTAAAFPNLHQSRNSSPNHPNPATNLHAPAAALRRPPPVQHAPLLLRRARLQARRRRQAPRLRHAPRERRPLQRQPRHLRRRARPRSSLQGHFRHFKGWKSQRTGGGFGQGNELGIKPVELFNGHAMELMKAHCQRLLKFKQVQELVELLDVLYGLHFPVKELVEPSEVIKGCVERRWPK